MQLRSGQSYNAATSSVGAAVSNDNVQAGTVPSITAEPRPSSIFDLPTELRQSVYRYIFQCTRLRQYREKRSADSNSHPPEMLAELSILFVNRLCLQEARPFMLQEACFTFGLVYPARESTWSLLRSHPDKLLLKLQDLSLVQHISLHSDPHRYSFSASVEDLQSLVALLPNLQTIRYDYCSRFPHMSVYRYYEKNPGRDWTTNAAILKDKAELMLSSMPTQPSSDPWTLLKVWKSRGQAFQLILVGTATRECPPNPGDLGTHYSDHYQWDTTINLNTRMMQFERAKVCDPDVNPRGGEGSFLVDEWAMNALLEHLG